MAAFFGAAAAPSASRAQPVTVAERLRACRRRTVRDEPPLFEQRPETVHRLVPHVDEAALMTIVRRRDALDDGSPALDLGRIRRGRRRSYVARDAGAAGTSPHRSSCSRRHGFRDRTLRGAGGWEFAS